MASSSPQTRPTPLWRMRAFAAMTLVLVAMGMVSWATASAQQGTARIGYVDMRRLIDNAPQARAANARLKAEFDSRDAELKADDARLAELELRAERAPDGETRAMLNRQADALRRSLERTRQRLKEELEIRGNEELDAIWPLINDAVAEFGRDNGYDLILTSPVVYVSGRIDVTDDVLAELRRQAGGTR